MKTLSEPVAMDFSKIRVQKVTIGDLELMGDCVLSIKPPMKGMPAWEIRYNVGEGNQVLYAASTPIRIDAAEIEQEQVQESYEDDE